MLEEDPTSPPVTGMGVNSVRTDSTGSLFENAMLLHPGGIPFLFAIVFEKVRMHVHRYNTITRTCGDCQGIACAQ